MTDPEIQEVLRNLRSELQRAFCESGNRCGIAIPSRVACDVLGYVIQEYDIRATERLAQLVADREKET